MDHLGLHRLRDGTAEAPVAALTSDSSSWRSGARWWLPNNARVERVDPETGEFHRGSRQGFPLFHGRPALLRRHVQLRASEMRVCESGIKKGRRTAAPPIFLELPGPWSSPTRSCGEAGRPAPGFRSLAAPGCPVPVRCCQRYQTSQIQCSPVPGLPRRSHRFHCFHCHLPASLPCSQMQRTDRHFRPSTLDDRWW